jgi:hypothetical protein
MAVPAMSLAMGTRSAEDTERGIRAADEPDARQDQGAKQDHARGRTKQPHQAPALPRRVGENRAAFGWPAIGVW